MKVQLEPDEFWPWFNILEADDPLGDGRPVEVDDDTLARWHQVLGDARTIQNEIREFIGWDK